MYLSTISWLNQISPLSFNKIDDNLYVQNIHEFSYAGKKYRFKKPYVLQYRTENGGFHFYDGKLDIFAYEDTRAGLFESFYDLFSLLWTEYAMEDNRKLDKKARKLKAFLLSLCDVTNA